MKAETALAILRAMGADRKRNDAHGEEYDPFTLRDEEARRHPAPIPREVREQVVALRKQVPHFRCKRSKRMDRMLRDTLTDPEPHRQNLQTRLKPMR